VQEGEEEEEEEQEGREQDHEEAGEEDDKEEEDEEASESVVQLLKLSVGLTCQAYLLEIDGLLTQGSRPGRTVGGSVGGFSGMDCSDWSNGIQYQIFDTRPDTEFNSSRGGSDLYKWHTMQCFYTVVEPLSKIAVL